MTFAQRCHSSASRSSSSFGGSTASAAFRRWAASSASCLAGKRGTSASGCRMSRSARSAAFRTGPHSPSAARRGGAASATGERSPRAPWRRLRALRSRAVKRRGIRRRRSGRPIPLRRPRPGSEIDPFTAREPEALAGFRRGPGSAAAAAAASASSVETQRERARTGAWRVPPLALEPVRPLARLPGSSRPHPPPGGGSASSAAARRSSSSRILERRGAAGRWRSIGGVGALVDDTRDAMTRPSGCRTRRLRAPSRSSASRIMPRARFTALLLLARETTWSSSPSIGDQD